MDFAPDPRSAELDAVLARFLTERVLPAEPVLEAELAAEPGRWGPTPVIGALQAEARSLGLWNLFLPPNPLGLGAGLTNLQYAPLAERSGRSPRLAPVAMNCAAPDTGNMELLDALRHGCAARAWLGRCSRAPSVPPSA